MMWKTLILSAVLLVLPGCVLPPDESDVPLTPVQSYYGVVRTYDAVLEAAVAYKDNCISRPAVLQEDCREVVRVLREVNREAQGVMLYADVAVIDGEPALLEQATVRLERLRDRLRQEVIAKMAADAAAREQVE